MNQCLCEHENIVEFAEQQQRLV